MPQGQVYPVQRIWSKGSSTSASSTSTSSPTSSTRSHTSRNSSHTQYTAFTSCSDSKPSTKHQEIIETYEVDDDSSLYEPRYEVDPRASIETYASTIADEQEHAPKAGGPCPLMRMRCYEPDALATTPAEFGELFPSTRRILIQHDDTTPDGNFNLRLDTELNIAKGHKVKMTLFHLRMYDLSERQFSLRRYQRQSGREVCSSKRKYLKPRVKPSPPPPKRLSLNSVFTRMSLRPTSVKPRPKASNVPDDSESEDDLDVCQPDVEATIPTNTLRLEFSNYAQVELHRNRRGDVKMYDFEYWGERYSWRRNIFEDEGIPVFSFELVNLTTGVCMAHITPDKLSRHQTRQEALEGSWVPPCSMRITEKNIPSDLGDVIVATGLLSLTDDCIRKHWREPHRYG